MHNPESFFENVTHKRLWDFDNQTDHLISARRPDLVVIKKKKKKWKKKKKKKKENERKKKKRELVELWNLLCQLTPQSKIERKRKERYVCGPLCEGIEKKTGEHESDGYAYCN